MAWSKGMHFMKPLGGMDFRILCGNVGWQRATHKWKDVTCRECKKKRKERADK